MLIMRCQLKSKQKLKQKRYLIVRRQKPDHLTPSSSPLWGFQVVASPRDRPVPVVHCHSQNYMIGQLIRNEKSKLTDLLDDILHELSVDWSSYDLKHREIRSVKHNKQSLQVCVNCAALRLWYDFLAILSGAKLWQSVAVGRLNMQDRRVRQIMSQHRPWGTWPI